MRERGPQEFARFSHCEFCGKPLTGKEYRLGCASHKSCWMTWCDRGRYSEEQLMSRDKSIATDRMGYMIADKPLYTADGKRYKDFKYGELL